MFKQECISVGCVPLYSVATSGSEYVPMVWGWLWLGMSFWSRRCHRSPCHIPTTHIHPCNSHTHPLWRPCQTHPATLPSHTPSITPPCDTHLFSHTPRHSPCMHPTDVIPCNTLTHHTHLSNYMLGYTPMWTDKQVWKRYLPATSLAGGKMDWRTKLCTKWRALTSWVNIIKVYIWQPKIKLKVFFLLLGCTLCMTSVINGVAQWSREDQHNNRLSFQSNQAYKAFRSIFGRSILVVETM